MTTEPPFDSNSSSGEVEGTVRRFDPADSPDTLRRMAQEAHAAAVSARRAAEVAQRHAEELAVALGVKFGIVDTRFPDD